MAKKSASFNRPASWPPASSSPLERGLWPWWLAIVAYLVVAIGSVAAGFLAFALPEDIQLAWPPVAQQALFAIGAILVPFLCTKHFSPSHLGLRRVPWRAAILGAVGLVVIMNFGEYLWTLASGSSGDSSAMLTSAGWGKSIVAEIGLILAVTIIAPVAEELIFRGVLYRTIRDAFGRFGTFVGIAIGGTIATMIFVDIHMDEEIVIGLYVLYFIMGAILTGLYEWTGSLIAPILAHAANNALVVVLVASKVAPTNPLMVVFAACGPLLATLLALLLQRVLKPLSK